MAAFFSKARILSFIWLFGVEASGTVALLAYLIYNTFAGAEAPASEVERLMWILRRGWMLVLPTFNFLWGCMRAFDKDVRCEDPFAGVESKRWSTFQKILTNNIEQTVMFVPAIVSFALCVPADMWPAVPAFLYTWTAGRFLFGALYFVPPLPGNPFDPLFTLPGWARSPGMNMTLYPLFFSIVGCAFYYTGECVAPPVPAKAGFKLF